MVFSLFSQKNETIRSTMEANSCQESLSVEDLHGLGIVRFFFVLSSWEGYGVGVVN